jgi:hypothetical protein
MAVMALTAASMVFVLPAAAHDNVRQRHWPGLHPGYTISQDFPDGWRDNVRSGDARWANNTQFDMNYNGIIGTNDPSGANSSIIWRGAIPGAWQDGCPTGTTIACTRTRTTNDPVSGGGQHEHIYDADMVFAQAFADQMRTSDDACKNDAGIDVETVAVHEMGHWAGLGHSGDSSTVMYADYLGCNRTPNSHDVNSMNEQVKAE